MHQGDSIMSISILGKRLHQVRRDRKLTQEQLARAIGVSSNTIARVERGAMQYLNGGTVADAARFLDVSADFLLGLSEEEKPNGHRQPAAPRRRQGAAAGQS
jgi:transcriptional regulator with XRE-family HTH domain